MPTLVLKIVAHEGDRLKIVWGEGETNLCFEAYFVYRAQLAEAVQKCRDALADMSAAFLDREFARYPQILRKLAARGADLYFLLFRGATNASGVAESVENWLKGMEVIGEPVRLIVSSDASVHVPWGLVFAGDEDALAIGTHSIDEYREFWAVKYELTVLYSGMAPKSLRQARERASFRMLSLLNRDVFMEGDLCLLDSEKRYLSRFLEFPEGCANTGDECKTKWNLMLASDCLLYVFAHATGTSIELSSSDTISLVELRRKFFDPRRRTRNRVPECLILLNGCETAVGDLDNGFLTATAEAGCCGFIGSEAPVPTEFAMRFGLALLDLLLHRGVPVVAALHQLRRQHWPVSLLYGCYSHPDFRVEADPDAGPLPFAQEVNFSYPGLNAL